jgi:hypothetical protein
MPKYMNGKTWRQEERPARFARLPAESAGRMIHPRTPHGESIGIAVDVFKGVHTDLLPANRR